jgi:DNA-binding NarL/FixJ family response regulator
VSEVAVSRQLTRRLGYAGGALALAGGVLLAAAPPAAAELAEPASACVATGTWQAGGLRALGVHRLPRRPQRATQANPGGLTDRQLQVLTLVTAGLTNSDIAARLHISPRTADHHVSAILTKLGARTRRDAARAARRWGLTAGEVASGREAAGRG